MPWASRWWTRGEHRGALRYNAAMYTPTHFKEERLDILHAAIARIGLATLVIHGEAGLQASQIPMVVDPTAAPLGGLSGHMARANPLWKRAKGDALAIFLGPHAYVS